MKVLLYGLAFCLTVFINEMIGFRTGFKLGWLIICPIQFAFARFLVDKWESRHMDIENKEPFKPKPKIEYFEGSTLCDGCGNHKLDVVPAKVDDSLTKNLCPECIKRFNAVPIKNTKEEE